MGSIPQLIVAAAADAGIDPNLALSVANAESGMNPNVADSPAGAIGVMQLMPATARALGVDPRDPEQNIRGGVALLANLLSQFGDVVEAVAAYNWNPNGVSSALARYGADWLSHAPAETQNYVVRVLGAQPAPSTPPPGPALSFPMPPFASTVPTSIPTGTLAMVGLGLFFLWAAKEGAS